MDSSIEAPLGGGHRAKWLNRRCVKHSSLSFFLKTSPRRESRPHSLDNTICLLSEFQLPKRVLDRAHLRTHPQQTPPPPPRGVDCGGSWALVSFPALLSSAGLHRTPGNKHPACPAPESAQSSVLRGWLGMLGVKSPFPPCDARRVQPLSLRAKLTGQRYLGTPPHPNQHCPSRGRGIEDRHLKGHKRHMASCFQNARPLSQRQLESPPSQRCRCFSSHVRFSHMRQSVPKNQSL